MTTVARVQIAGFNTNHVSIASVVKAAAHHRPSSDGLELIAQCFVLRAPNQECRK